VGRGSGWPPRAGDRGPLQGEGGPAGVVAAQGPRGRRSATRIFARRTGTTATGRTASQALNAAGKAAGSAAAAARRPGGQGDRRLREGLRQNQTTLAATTRH